MSTDEATAGGHAVPADRPAALRALLARRSVAPRRLGPPGPDARALAQAVRAALRGPDHGKLAPWRLIDIEAARHGELGELFAEEKLRRDPLASSADVARAREHATRAPTLLAFVVSPRSGTTVPAQEQWLAAGAALGNVLNALDALGFGAIVLSGDRCADPVLKRALGLHDSEVLAGFISAGTVVQVPASARDQPLDRVWSTWGGVHPLEPASCPHADAASGPVTLPARCAR